MPHCPPIGSAICAVAILCAAPSRAEISARDVWDDMRTWLERAGYTLDSGARERSDDALTVRDVSVAFAGYDDDVEIRFDLGTLILRERDDGGVGIVLPRRMTMAIRESSVDLAIDLSMRRPAGLSIVASGDPDETVYTFAGDGFAIETAAFEIDGRPIDVDLRGGFSDYAGRYVMSSGETTSVSSDWRAASFDMTARGTAPDGDVTFALSAGARDLSASSHMVLPEVFDTGNMARTLASGFASESDYTAGETTFEFSLSDGRERLEVTGGAGGTVAVAAIDKDRVSLSSIMTDLSAAVSGLDTPVPRIALSAAEYGLKLLAPVSKSDAPEDFSFGLWLVDLDPGDALRGLFDPGGVLPRDPATLALDLSGKGNWLIDILDVDAWEAWEAWDAEAPGALHALSLNNLRLSGAGAALTATGDFTFDNDDLTTFDGAPRPEGAIEVKLTGVNGLLDALAEIGLLPRDQALAARMTLGLFTVPGVGEDEMTTTIEIDAQGAVIANGLPLR